MTKIDGVFLVSFALVLKKTSWYRRRYSRPLRVKLRVAMIQCILSSSWTGYMLIKVRHDLPEVGFVNLLTSAPHIANHS